MIRRTDTSRSRFPNRFRSMTALTDYEPLPSFDPADDAETVDEWDVAETKKESTQSNSTNAR